MLISTAVYSMSTSRVLTKFTLMSLRHLMLVDEKKFKNHTQIKNRHNVKSRNLSYLFMIMYLRELPNVWSSSWSTNVTQPSSAPSVWIYLKVENCKYLYWQTQLGTLPGRSAMPNINPFVFSIFLSVNDDIHFTHSCSFSINMKFNTLYWSLRQCRLLDSYYIWHALQIFYMWKISKSLN